MLPGARFLVSNVEWQCTILQTTRRKGGMCSVTISQLYTPTTKENVLSYPWVETSRVLLVAMPRKSSIYHRALLKDTWDVGSRRIFCRPLQTNFIDAKRDCNYNRGHSNQGEREPPLQICPRNRMRKVQSFFWTLKAGTRFYLNPGITLAPEIFPPVQSLIATMQSVRNISDSVYFWNRNWNAIYFSRMRVNLSP